MIQNETHSLAMTHPEIARRWHPTKNGNLTPEMVSAGSNKKVWWYLPCDIPMDYPVAHLRGKHFDFEWQERVTDRIRASSPCPFLAKANAKVWQGFNDLKTINPELAAQWHPTKNGDLIPEMISKGYSEKVWWKYSYDVPMDHPIEHLRGKHFEFEWEATVSNRANGNKCPFLTGKAVWKGFNDLATTHPELVKEWHPTKNGNLKPSDITYGSSEKVWWYLPYDIPVDYPIECLRGKHFDFEWEATVGNRTKKDGSGCPFLFNQAIFKGFNDLETVNFELAAQWHPTKNIGLKNKKGEDISTPDKIAPNAGQKVWWYFPYDVPIDYPIEHLRGKHFDFEWEATVADRAAGNNCPFLSGQAVWYGFNDLLTVNPELATQWHPVKNKGLKDDKGNDISTPDKVGANSKHKVWWHLLYDVPMDYPIEHLRGKHFDFEWEATIENRANGAECPYLTSNAIWKGFNDLETINPELAAEWHPIKNIGLKDTKGRDISSPDKVAPRSNQKVWWLYSYDVPTDYPIEHLRGKHFDFEWEARIAARSRGDGCPFLSEGNPKTWKGFNDLATTHPELVREWHSIKNGSLTPFNISRGSIKTIWWNLPYDVPMDYPVEYLRGKHFDFEWEASPNTRTSLDLGCPFLSSHRVWKGFNDLVTTHPNLITEWNYEKNIDINPDSISYGSTKKVWWMCKQGHEWVASPNDRTNSKTSCPICAESHGEASVRKVLKENSVFFEEQYKFEDRHGPSGKQLLRDDFAIFNTYGQVVATIEYHGEQHYEPVDFAGKGNAWAKKQLKLTQERDKVKTEYLESRNIPQLIIPYWEFDNVEKIVKNFIDKLSNDYDL